MHTRLTVLIYILWDSTSIWYVVSTWSSDCRHSQFNKMWTKEHKMDTVRKQRKWDTSIHQHPVRQIKEIHQRSISIELQKDLVWIFHLLVSDWYGIYSILYRYFFIYGAFPKYKLEMERGKPSVSIKWSNDHNMVYKQTSCFASYF